jgi:hypothetical protein
LSSARIEVLLGYDSTAEIAEKRISFCLSGDDDKQKTLARLGRADRLIDVWRRGEKYIFSSPDGTQAFQVPLSPGVEKKVVLSALCGSAVSKRREVAWKSKLLVLWEPGKWDTALPRSRLPLV